MATRTLAAAKPEIVALASNYISQGFVELPLEIIYRIVSAAQGAIIPCVNEAAMDKKYSERRDSLLALCQVCRLLRIALLPLLWERLEACCLPGDQDDQDDRERWSLLAKLLAGQLEVISVTQPLYASYVRIVNIAIEPTVASEMLYNLAPALALMQNLHTIQIVIDKNLPKVRPCNIRIGVATFLNLNAFKDHLYPSVKRAILPGQAMTVVKCFPNLREVCLNQAYHGTFLSFLDNLAMNCDKLEMFGWIQFSQYQDMLTAAIAESLPKIRGMEYHIRDFNANEISQLARLQNLEDLSLIIDTYDNLSQCDAAVLEVVEATKKVLETSSSINKRLNVILPSETRSFTFCKNQD